jgi:hypothetical protein
MAYNLAPFQCDWHLCPLIDGVSAADQQRFAAAAVGFVGALVKDPRLTALQASWRAVMKAVLWLSIAKALEVRQILEVRQVPGPIHQARRLAIHQARRFVEKDLRMPWPWVAQILLQDCLFDAFSEITGHPLDRTVRAGRNVVAPPLHLKPIPGESTEEQRQRLAEACLRLEYAEQRAIDETRAGRGRAPKNRGAIYQDYGRWLYEAEYRVPRRSYHALGRELAVHRDHAHPAVCDCYKTVSRGIKEARRLFGLCAVTWDSLGPARSIRRLRRTISPRRRCQRPRGR